jgi:penicillin-binding protein 2
LSPGQPISSTSSRSDLREFDGRLRLLAILFAIPMCVLGYRLYQLQIVQGAAYYQLANENFVREVELAPERGRIVDAQGRVLAENRPSYDVYASPQVLASRPEAFELALSVLNVSEESGETLRQRILARGVRDIVLRRDISRDQVAQLETRNTELPGVYVVVSQRRHYPYDALAAHLLGYMNEVTARELDAWEDLGYHPGDYVGRSGLERAFEPILRGAPGLDRQVIDVSGNVQNEHVNRQLLGDYRHVDPVPGKNLVLTVDMELQAIMEEAAGDALSGGVVALDPRDGTILGMFSKPGFNPNAWSGRLSEQEKRQSDNNPFHPMLDKTVLSWFPASTYKFITAIAGLEEGQITDETTIECPGYFDYGNRRFHCWNRYGHGELNLREAMAVSCDVFFYQVGLELGIDTLASYAYEFGFGERPGLGLNGESAGVVPTRAWHEENSPGGFQYGFTVNTSVGQGDTRTSPLQLALAYGAIANGGTLYYPRLVDRITTWDDSIVFEYPGRVRRELRVSDEHLADVVSGLRAVVHDEIGTAHATELPWMNVAGKTGTAQVRSLGTERLQDGEVIHWDRDHAWFVAFAPIEEPQFVVAVFLEHGGQGSTAAAPVAMRIVDRYFREVLGWDESVEMVTFEGDSAEITDLMEQDSAAGAALRQHFEAVMGIDVSERVAAEYAAPAAP